MKFWPGVVPQWPTTNGFTSESANGRFNNGLSTLGHGSRRKVQVRDLVGPDVVEAVRSPGGRELAVRSSLGVSGSPVPRAHWRSP